MRAYVLAALAISAVLLSLFGIAHALGVPLLSDASPGLGAAGPGAAAASFALLATDVLLPVPSSALMLLNGALFGWLGGTLLSLAGSEAAALLAWAIGRRGGRLLERGEQAGARARADAFVRRRGALAIIVTRPVPVLAETTAILAGAAGMPLRRLTAAAAVGSLPPALGYALAGAYAGRFDAGPIVLAGVLTLAAAFWLLDRRRAAAVTAGG
ncbi:MAG: hypothetical protein AVDCRST_MAG67-427 [uncultured Solirubrobacteraceae bacterium]|uniref:VTT domain-containing protein n=1 Tax=uncultured Solirubrobacteraceae bacterium TaxID=1162706 RepID=A0A6J4RIH8_9ACTN|nr:MAG: hypothetical protein AVDCRST_MAG67-427 [uncultured Solirubrobacteraceae bacterium]